MYHFLVLIHSAYSHLENTISLERDCAKNSLQNVNLLKQTLHGIVYNEGKYMPRISATWIKKKKSNPAPKEVIWLIDLSLGNWENTWRNGSL